MKVKITKNPKSPTGLRIGFPYDPVSVETIKKPLGTVWNNKERTWESEGPEILLDFARFGIEIDYLSQEAREVAEVFRQKIWDTMDCRLIDLEAEQYAYQKQGSIFLATMENSILADDMGTGKSKQSLDAAAMIGGEFGLILCPKTLTYNWKEEVEKWHPEWKVGVVPDERDAPKKVWHPNRKDFWDNPPNIVIANYEKVLLNDWPFNIEWDFFIPDEATRLKNSTTSTYKQVKKIVRRAKRTWALTGTPLEIRVQELYSILSLLRPSVLGNFMRFRDQHCVTDWSGQVVGIKELELLRDRIGPFMLRRTKKELQAQLQIPGKLPPNNHFVELSMPEKKAYEAFTDDFNNWLTEHGVSGGDNAMVQTMRMRQFCCTPDLFTDELGRGSKFKALEEIVNEWDGNVVIFCFFKEVTKRLKSWLNIHPEAYIDGDVSAGDGERQRRVNEFNKGNLGKVFISTDAGKFGLNIVGADLIIHYDQLWNPQTMNQREDRLDRIGQQKLVNVINLMCIDTIDYGMYLVNLEREKLFEEIVDGTEEAILRKLDAPRLRRIVEGRL